MISVRSESELKERARTAWLSLPEQDKQALSKTLHKIAAHYMTLWVEEAGITGFTAQKAASRPKVVQKRLDQTFFKIADGRFAAHMIAACLLAQNAARFHVPRQQLTNPNYREALEPLISQYPDASQLINLFIAVMDWRYPEGLPWGRLPEPNDPVEEIVELAQDNDAQSSPIPCPPIFDLESLRKTSAAATGLIDAAKGLQDFLSRAPSLISGLKLSGKLPAVPDQFNAHFSNFFSKAAACDSMLSNYRDGRNYTEGGTSAAPEIETLVESLADLAAKKRPTIEAVLSDCHGLRDIVDQILSQASDLDKQVSEKLATTQEIESYLERPASLQDAPLASKNLIAALRHAAAVQAAYDEAQKDLNDHLATEKRRISDAIQDLTRDYEPDKMGPQLQLILTEIREKIPSITTVSAWRDLTQKYSDFQKSIASRPELKSATNLALKAIAHSAEAATIINLARGLSSCNRAIEALGLLIVLQETTDLNETDLNETNINDFSQFVEVLIDIAVGSALKTAPGFHWIDAIFQEKWVHQLTASDVQSHRAIKRLAVAFVVQQHVRGTENERDILYNLHLHNAFSTTAYPVMHRVFDGLIRGRAPIILEPSSTAALKSIEKELRGLFLRDHHRNYVIGIAPGGPFRVMEQRHLLPVLEELANRVFDFCSHGKLDEAISRLERFDGEKTYLQACAETHVAARENAFFLNRILNPNENGYIPRILGLLSRYVNERRKSTNEPYVLVPELIDDLVRAEAEDQLAHDFYEHARQAVRLPGQSQPQHVNSPIELLATLCNHQPEFAALAPSLVMRLCTQASALPTKDDLFEIIRKIADPETEVSNRFYACHCYRHAALAAAYRHVAPEAQDELLRVEEDTRAALIRKWEDYKEDSLNIISEERFHKSIENGYYPFLEHQFARLEKQLDTRREKESDILSGWIRVQAARIQEFEHRLVTSGDTPEEWREQLLAKTGFITRKLRLAAAPASKLFRQHEQRKAVEKAITAIEFVIENKSRDFAELQSWLDAIGQDAASRPNTPKHPPEQREIRVPEVRNPWRAIANKELTDAELTKPWQDLVYEFSRICELKRDLHESLTLVKYETNPQLKDYPFRVYETRFRLPRSRFLSRPIRLYLCPGDRVTRAQMEILSNECASEDLLHLVFVPTKFQAVRKEFRYDIRRSNYLLLDDALLAQVCGSEKPDVPLRQALHRSVKDLTLSKVFKSDGFVHQENDIFVGRQDTLQRLSQQLWSVMWGGRRMGKTSLMHALKKRLERMGRWRVALVYAARDLGADPDLSLAQDIAKELDLPRPESLADLHRILQEERGKTRIAILLDEMDAYIEQSTKKHGDSYPLAKLLRSLTQTDSAQNIKLVYAGFKHLYYQCKMKPVSETGYPFRQFLQHVDLDDLTFDDVSELVRIGFVEMLGVDVEPAVPRHIIEAASGHPAFVQRFCERLLGRLQPRWEPGAPITLTVDDVQAVANESENTGEGEPFVFYVKETLGWNLSHLGRAIVLTLSERIKHEGSDPKRDFNFVEIHSVLGEWAKICDLPPPEVKDVEQTVELLRMTNMLKLTGLGTELRYRISYPTYVKILNELDRTKQMEIVSSLSAYTAEERERICEF